MSKETQTQLTINDECTLQKETSKSIQIPTNAANTNFGWLDKWMMYCLCIPKLPLNKKRSKLCVAAIKLLYIIYLILIILSFLVLLSTYLLTSSISKGSDVFVSAVRIGAYFCILLQTILTMHYYYFSFNYPWHSQIPASISLKEEKDHDNINKWYKIIIQMFIAMQIIVLCIFGIYCGLAGDWIHVAMRLEVMLEIGVQFFPFVIQAAICFKYYWYLAELATNVATTNTYDVLGQYKLVYDAFHEDYKFSLKWSVRLIIAMHLLSVWLGINLLNRYAEINRDHNIVVLVEDLIYFIIIFFLYILSSSSMNRAFELFQHALWNKIHEGDEVVFESTISLITYTTKYPIDISFGSLRVTMKNVLLFVVAFIATRIAAVLIKRLDLY